MNAIAVPRWDPKSGTLEALKWGAFVLMLVDHANTVFFERSVTWAYDVGRVVFPIFALVLAYNLTRKPLERSGPLFSRLLVVGALSQIPAMLSINGGALLPLNILWTFAAGLIVLVLIAGEDLGWQLVGWGGFWAAGFVVDYAWPGVALLPAAYWYWRDRGALAFGTLVAAIAGVCLVNGNVWAFAGAAAVVAAGYVPEVACPRLRWAFWFLYPAHLVALGVAGFFVP